MSEGLVARPRGRQRLVNRGLLAGALVQQCQQRYGDRVTFHFSSALHSLDTQKGTATFRACDKESDRDTIQVEFDLLVGADGAGSAVRQAVMQQDSDLQV